MSGWSPSTASPATTSGSSCIVAEARPRIAAELATADDDALTGLHRRFEVVAGAQAQVDWGDEGRSCSRSGSRKVYSFHMTLSYSRDPFCCFTTSQDLATFFDCHRRAFAHFGGVPGQHRLRPHQDRRQTPCRARAGGAAAPGGGGVRRALRLRHRRAGRLPADREGPGRAAGRDRPRPRPGRPRASTSIAELDARVRRRGCRSAAARSTAPTARSSASAPRPDRAALRPLPDAAVSGRPSGICAGSGRTAWSPSTARYYSVPARRSAPGSGSRCRCSPTRRHGDRSPSTPWPSTAAAGSPPPRATRRGAWRRPGHWDGLPDGHTRAATVDPSRTVRPRAASASTRWRRCCTAGSRHRGRAPTATDYDTAARTDHRRRSAERQITMAAGELAPALTSSTTAPAARHRETGCCRPGRLAGPAGLADWLIDWPACTPATCARRLTEPARHTLATPRPADER